MRILLNKEIVIMAFTFKDAFEEIDEKAFYIEKDETWANVSSSVVYLVMDLQETYAPTIKMTEAEKTLLMNYLEMSSLSSFMDLVLYSNGLYDNLSDEELAQAWLHPESIEIVR